MPICTICGEEKSAGQVWFLIAESHWADKLKILEWKDELSQQEGIHRACCPDHVNELVLSWMATEGLGHLLPSWDANSLGARRGRTPGLPIVSEPPVVGARQIGELTIDRESVGRALKDNPESLHIILDELSEVLTRETASPASRLESGAAMISGWLRQM
jgi:hypothetical protein